MNIEEIDKWLKEEYGISYSEMGNEFNSAMELLNKYQKRYSRLHSIIKEVREYVEEELSQGGERDIRDLVNGYAILEILDKGVIKNE